MKRWIHGWGLTGAAIALALAVEARADAPRPGLGVAPAPAPRPMTISPSPASPPPTTATGMPGDRQPGLFREGLGTEPPVPSPGERSLREAKRHRHRPRNLRFFLVPDADSFSGDPFAASDDPWSQSSGDRGLQGKTR